MPYDLKLRQKVITLSETGVSLRSVARRFLLAPSTVIRWHKAYKETGVVSPAQPRKRVKKKLDNSKEYIIKQLTLTPDITLSELREKLYECKNIKVSHSTVDRYVKSLGYSYKKNSKSSGKPTYGRTQEAPSMEE